MSVMSMLVADALDSTDPDFDLLHDVWPSEAEFERCQCSCCCVVEKQEIVVPEIRLVGLADGNLMGQEHVWPTNDHNCAARMEEEEEEEDEDYILEAAACPESTTSHVEAQNQQSIQMAEMKKGRSWTENQKKKHRSACKGKRRLTLAQKLEIVRMQESASPGDKKTQAQIAEMYGKCRSAISKILHPRNIAKIKKSLNIGVDLTIRRCSAVTEFERKFLESLGEDERSALMSNGPFDGESWCKRANALAKEIGTVGFEANSGWLSRRVTTSAKNVSYKINRPFPDGSLRKAVLLSYSGAVWSLIHRASELNSRLRLGKISQEIFARIAVRWLFQEIQHKIALGAFAAVAGQVLAHRLDDWNNNNRGRVPSSSHLNLSRTVRGKSRSVQERITASLWVEFGFRKDWKLWLKTLCGPRYPRRGDWRGRWGGEGSIMSGFTRGIQEATRDRGKGRGTVRNAPGNGGNRGGAMMMGWG
eukprot:761543-Hanusia_phi.AAC.1